MSLLLLPTWLALAVSGLLTVGTMGMGDHADHGTTAGTSSGAFPTGSPCELTELVLTQEYTAKVCYVTEPFALHGRYPLYVSEAGAVAASTHAMPMATGRGGHGFKFYSPESSWGFKDGDYNATADGMYTMHTNRTVVSCNSDLCLSPSALHFGMDMGYSGSICEESHMDFHGDMGMHDADMCFVPQPFALAGAYPLYFTMGEAMAASPGGMAHSMSVGPETFYMPMGVPMWHGDYNASGSSGSGGGHAHDRRKEAVDKMDPCSSDPNVCLPINSTSSGEYCNQDGTGMAMCMSCDGVSRGCENQMFTDSASLASCLARCPGRGLKQVSCGSALCGMTSSYGTVDSDTETATGSPCVPSGNQTMATTGGMSLTVSLCAVPQPFALNGNYPLYLTQSLAVAASPTNMSHTHDGYHMPMGVTMYHGDYTGSVMAMDMIVLSCDDPLCIDVPSASPAPSSPAASPTPSSTAANDDDDHHDGVKIAVGVGVGVLVLGAAVVAFFSFRPGKRATVAQQQASTVHAEASGL